MRRVRISGTGTGARSSVRCSFDRPIDERISDGHGLHTSRQRQGNGASRARLRRMREAGRRLGAPAAVPRMRQCRLLRRVEEQARDEAFPHDAPSADPLASSRASRGCGATWTSSSRASCADPLDTGDRMEHESKTIAALASVTTATLTTLLLKKGTAQRVDARNAARSAAARRASSAARSRCASSRHARIRRRRSRGRNRRRRAARSRRCPPAASPSSTRGA